MWAATQAGGRVLGDVQALPQRGIGLLRELQDVAAIGEHGRAIGQHDGEAGTAGEAGQPGETLGGGGDVLAQMLVGARDDEAVQSNTADFRPQFG